MRKVIVVNSCTVTGEADRKSRQMVRRFIRENPGAAVIVTGCAAEADPEVFSKINGVYAVIGNREKLKCVDAALNYKSNGLSGHKSCKGSKCNFICSGMENADFEQMSISAFRRTRAYLKIEDGCESKCAYCIIPRVRGKIRSKSPDIVINEAQTLVSGGCPEIVLTGVETSAYQYDLADLIKKLDTIPGLERIRLGSLDPSFVKPDFIAKYASCKHTMPHFHLSMQSGCDQTLFSMRRRYNIETVKKYIDNIKKVIPDACLSADVICGFPGETDEDFEKTLAFFDETQFLHLHIFPFSDRPGTEAADMPNKLPREVIKQRVLKLSEQQKKIKKDILLNILKKPNKNGFHNVLVETVSDKLLTGHNESFAEFSIDISGKLPKDRSAQILNRIKGSVIEVRSLYSNDETIFASFESDFKNFG